MRTKNKLGIFGLASVVAVSALFLYTQEEPYSSKAVVESLWDKYEGDVQSTQMPAEGFPVIDVSVYDKDDITDVENYLESNLSEEDLEQYKLNVYQYSSDAGKFRDNAQENLDTDELNPDN